MANQELLSYIHQALSSGITREKIKEELLRTGWPASDVDGGFAETDGVPTPPPRIPQVSPPETKKDSFPSPSAVINPLQTPTERTGFSMKTVIIAITTAACFLLIGGAGYAYMMKIGPFARPPYSEKNLVSGVLGAMSQIDTSSYLLSVSLAVGKRDADAKPFVLKNSDNAAFRKQYQNDAKRAQDISSLLSELQYQKNSGSQTYNPYSPIKGGKTSDSNNTYPDSLQKIKKTADTYYYGGNFSTADPATGKPYIYALTDHGQGFALTATFETRETISLIKKSYRFSATTTIIDGQKVTFTNGSDTYLYFPSEPPKPFLVELSDSLSFLPAEATMKASASAQADWKKADSADWKFNAAASGDFGDLTYKADVDVLKKDGVYYFKVNNMPSFILTFFGNVKGQWLMVDPSKASSTNQDPYGDSFSILETSLPEYEKSYKDNRKELTALIKKAVTIADEENLFTLKAAPKSERIEGRLLYRYDLQIRKAAIVPFYKRLLKEADAMNLKKDFPMITDEGYLEYLRGSEFGELFDYYEKNTSLTLWADAKGFPATLTYSIRVTPADTATQLKDKQVDILFTLALSDINAPVKIEKPQNAKPLQSLMNEGSLGSARLKSRDARRVADIKQLQLATELYFDAHAGYPSKLSDLAQSYIPSLPTDPLDKSSYHYTTYTSNKIRYAYHLGASLEDPSSTALASDADCNSISGAECKQKASGSWVSSGSFNGADDNGCGGEKDRYCYDATP